MKNQTLFQHPYNKTRLEDLTESDFIKFLKSEKAPYAFLKKIRSMEHAYDLELAAQGYVKKFSSWMKENFADLSDLHLEENTPLCNIPYMEEFKEYNQKTDIFWQCIPCWKKGFIKVTKQKYIGYEVLNITPEKKSMEVVLTDFVMFKKPQHNIICHAELIISNRGEIKPESSFLDCMVTGEVFVHNCINKRKRLHMMPIQKLGYKSRYEIDIWNALLKYVDTLEIKSEDPFGLCSAFTQSISIINFFLSKNSHIKTPAGKTSGMETAKTGEVIIPEKKVYIIGNVKMKADKKPKAPTDSRKITYHLPNWQRRGHTRHYKSGKTIWIPETTVKRKCMKNYPKTSIQKQIIIRN